MTDLGPDPTATCERCGAQNDSGAARCSACDAPLTKTEPDAQRGDLELEEVWRAAAASGFDLDVRFDDGTSTCPNCGADLGLDDLELDDVTAVTDTPTNRDLAVATFRCPSCSAGSRAEVPVSRASDADRASPDAEPPPEVDQRSSPPAGASDGRPLGADRRFFEAAGPGSLAERGSLVDEEGEDIRQYTGEPVETEEGWVLPQQQNVGKDNMAGEGEWPDPNRPSAMPDDAPTSAIAPDP